MEGNKLHLLPLVDLLNSYVEIFPSPKGRRNLNHARRCHTIPSRSKRTLKFSYIYIYIGIEKISCVKTSRV